MVDTRTYFDMLYTTPGFAVTGLANAGAWDKTKQRVWRIPMDTAALVEYCESASQTHDVYSSVSLFGEPQRLAPLALPSPWLHIDQDGSEWHGIEPTMRIESSPGKYHSYFLLDEPLQPEKRARVLKALTSKGEGDPKAADVSRVLRPPGTWSHKRGAPVRYVGGSGEAYTLSQVVGERVIPRRGKIAKDDGTDLEAFLQANGVLANERADYKGVKYEVECPWADSHTAPGTTAYIGKITEGPVWFSCYHMHCEGHGWWDYRDEVQGELSIWEA